MHNRYSALRTGVASIVFASGVATAAEAVFIPLGNVDGVPGCNQNGCYVSADPHVSGDGRVVYGKSFVAGDGYSAVPYYPFRWTAASGLEALGESMLDTRLVSAISTDGDRVFGRWWSWSASTGWVNHAPDMPWFHQMAAGAVDLGMMAGVDDNYPRTEEVFIWNVDAGEQLQYLPTPDVGQTALDMDLAMSGNGEVIGGAVLLPDYKSSPALWTVDGTFRLIGDLNPDERVGAVADLSHDGTVAVGYSREADFGVAGFRWTETEGIVSIAETGDQRSFSPARACNADGSVIVGQTRTFGNDEGDAYIWTTERGMDLLRTVLINEFGLAADLSGWQLIEATDVSDDGRTIVGNGINPQGRLEAWYVQLDVETDTCPADLDDNGTVDVDDLLTLLASFNSSGNGTGDIDGNGTTDVADLLALLAAFGPCP